MCGASAIQSAAVELLTGPLTLTDEAGRGDLRHFYCVRYQSGQWVFGWLWATVLPCNELGVDMPRKIRFHVKLWNLDGAVFGQFAGTS